MQMIFSGAGIGGCHLTLSIAKSGECPAASSASLVSAPAAITSRSVGCSRPWRADRSTMPLSVTKPYLGAPLTEKLARRGQDIEEFSRASSSAKAGDPVHGFGEVQADEHGILGR